MSFTLLLIILLLLYLSFILTKTLFLKKSTYLYWNNGEVRYHIIHNRFNPGKIFWIESFCPKGRKVKKSVYFYKRFDSKGILDYEVVYNKNGVLKYEIETKPPRRLHINVHNNNNVKKIISSSLQDLYVYPDLYCSIIESTNLFNKIQSELYYNVDRKVRFEVSTNEVGELVEKDTIENLCFLYYKNGSIKNEFTTHDNPFNRQGLEYVYYDSGEVEMIINYNSKGESHGFKKRFYKNGQILSYSTYNNNFIFGVSVSWYWNGQIRSLTRYKDGFKIYDEFWEKDETVIFDDTLNEVLSLI